MAVPSSIVAAGDTGATTSEGPGDWGPDDRGPGDWGPDNRGPGDRRPGDWGPDNRGPGDRRPGDRGPGDRGPGDRGPGELLTERGYGVLRSRVEKGEPGSGVTSAEGALSKDSLFATGEEGVDIDRECSSLV